MKNKILFISLAVVLALSIGLIGCEGTTEPTCIKVGLVRDTDGILSFYDQTAGGPTYRAFIKYVNDGGGIYMNNYSKSLNICPTVREYDPLAAGELSTQTYALIDSDKVHFVWGGPGTGTIYEQAPICDAKGVLLATLEGGATDMMADPTMLDSWANTFVNLSFSDWYQIPAVYQILQQCASISTPKAYVCYIQNEHGFEYLNVTKQVFGDANVKAVGHNAFTADQSAINDIVQGAINALNSSHGDYWDYDIFCGWTYDPYLSFLMTAFDALDFDPPHIVMGPGAQSGAYLYVYGANMDGIMGFATATNETDVTTSCGEAVTMNFSTMWSLIKPENTGAAPDAYCYDPWGHPVIWAGLEMWADAVEAVGHLGAGYTPQVRDVLVSTNFTTVMGKSWYKVFGGGTGGGVIDYKCMPTQICQWQFQVVEAIGPCTTPPYPKYMTTGTFNSTTQGNWNWL